MCNTEKIINIMYLEVYNKKNKNMVVFSYYKINVRASPSLPLEKFQSHSQTGRSHNKIPRKPENF